MLKMVQIRNVPDALHRTLKVRAAASGPSTSPSQKRSVRRSSPATGHSPRRPDIARGSKS